MILTESAHELLATQDYIEFALLFGSFAGGQPQPWSDVDVGIHLARPRSLLELGKLTAELERGLRRDVDLLVLNVAVERNPALAYKVVAEGELIFCRDRKALVEFKTRAILRYLDTAFLRAMVSRAFQKRLETGQFGKGG